jgi:multicomponent Na+:H+ antiporter subunit F
VTTLYLAAALVLLVTLLAGLGRTWRGPTATDRIMSAQLFGTTGVGVLLLLAEVRAEPGLQNVALVFALLAVLATAAFVRSPRPADRTEDRRC